MALLLRKCLSLYNHAYNSVLGLYGCQVKYLRFRKAPELDKSITDKPLLPSPYPHSSCQNSH